MLAAIIAAAVLDCGSDWACFRSAIDRGQSATVVSNASATGRIRMTISSVGSTRMTVNVRQEGSAASSCTFQPSALENLALDAQIMESLAFQDFIAADSCSGPLSAATQERLTIMPLPLESAITAGALDCEFSYGCLVHALRNQRDATLWVAESLPLFGLEITAVALVKVSNFASGDVTFYEKTVKNAVAFTPQIRAQMRARGMSQADIAAAQRQASARAAHTTGNDGTCAFKEAALEQMLRRWHDGSYSSDDWKTAEHCTGKLFSSSELSGGKERSGSS